MKISYGSSQFELKYIYLIAICFLLLSDSIFLELVFGKLEQGKPLPFKADKILLNVSLFFSVLFYFKYTSGLRNILLLGLVYFGFLVAESTFFYNSYFIYPHVFSKILELFLVFLMYVFFKDTDEKGFNIVAYLICVAAILNIVIYHAEILSISAFLNTERGLGAPSAFLLLVPTLFFFNKYFENKSTLFLILFFVNISLIAFLQHRSVWIATAVALFINVLLFKKAGFKISGQLYAPLIFIPVLGCFLLFSIIFSGNPEIIEKIKDRADDIVNYKTEGTGSWRYQQFESYLPFIKDNLFFGMRFEGFELPIQFYHLEAGTPNFNDGTGHHFHSYYVDKLFYFGIAGLLILLAPVFYIISKTFKKKSLSPVQLTLICFCISGVFYGISYDWPSFYMGFVGITIAYLNSTEAAEPEVDGIEEFNERVRSLKKELV
jgi:hypothetical protein